MGTRRSGRATAPAESSSARVSAPAPEHRLGRAALFLALVASDATYRMVQAAPPGGAPPIWQGKCIHCQSPLWVDAKGRPGPGVTLEHIVPTSLGGGNGCDNLALACARCNQQKGSRLDVLGLHHPRLRAVVETLQARRRRRWRAPPPQLQLSPAALAWLAAAPQA